MLVQFASSVRSAVGDAVLADAVAMGAGVLAAVFLVSGVGKFRHPMSTALAMVRFGLLPTVRAWAGRGAGATEITVAAALLLWPTLLLPLMAAGGLLLLFVALITSALLRGDRFPCACFGTHGAPISLGTLARTTLLLAVAAGSLVLVARGAPGPDAVTRVVGLCSGALLVSAIALASEIRRTGAFDVRFSNDV